MKGFQESQAGRDSNKVNDEKETLVEREGDSDSESSGEVVGLKNQVSDLKRQLEILTSRVSTGSSVRFSNGTEGVQDEEWGGGRSDDSSDEDFSGDGRARTIQVTAQRYYGEESKVEEEDAANARTSNNFYGQNHFGRPAASNNATSNGTEYTLPMNPPQGLGNMGEDDEKSPLQQGLSRNNNSMISLIGDEKSYTFQDSIYLQLLTEKVLSPGFFAPVVILVLAVVTLILVIYYAFQEGTPGNPLNIPSNVRPEVRVAQILGGIIGILTEQESIQGVMLFRFALESSLKYKVGREYYGVQRWRIILCAFTFLAVGYLFLVNLVLVIIKADDVLNLFYDMVALEFVLHVDDLAFWLSQSGIFGSRVQEATQHINRLEIDHDKAATRAFSDRKVKVPMKRILYLVNFLAIFLVLMAFWIMQTNGDYGCQTITIEFGDETWEGAIVKGESEERALLYSYFNGQYKINGTHHGYPKYVEQNKEDAGPFKKTTPAEIVYCVQLQSWVFRHPHIVKSTDEEEQDDDEKKYCNWLARSTETLSFDVTESSTDEWDIWVGTIQSGTSVSVVCAECENDSDCNYNGKCGTDKKCECKEDYFGQKCQFDMPCGVLVTENMQRGNRTQLLMVKSDDDTNENFVKSYDRPIYTMNGLSGVPEALLSVRTKEHWQNGRYATESSVDPFEDDDFFREAMSEYDILKDTFFEFGKENIISLRNYAVTLAFSGSRWFGIIDKPDLDVKRLYNSDYHAFWANTYSERTFLVSGPASNGDPVGVSFFSPRRRKSENDYGPFGVLLPNADIDGIGFFQCYANSENCTYLDIAVSTQNKTLPSNIEQYFSDEQRVSWKLAKGNSSQVEQESSSVLLGSEFIHQYCLAGGVYTYELTDDVCKHPWWDCEDGPGESAYNISVNDRMILNANVLQESKVTFLLGKDEKSNFCEDIPNFNATITTDGSPFETSWTLTTGEGFLLLSGGPYPYYKSFSTYSHLACLVDGDYIFTLLDSGGDGMNPPGHYGIMVGVGDELKYLVKGGRPTGGSISTPFSLLSNSLSSPPSSDVPPDGQDTFKPCSMVFSDISGKPASTLDDTISWSLLDVKKEKFVFESQSMDIENPNAPCLYEGAYTYINKNSYQCVGDDLMHLLDSQSSLTSFEGEVCRNDTFSFIVKQTDEDQTLTTLQNGCMDNFHLIVPSDAAKQTADTSWELAGETGVVFRGNQFGDSSAYFRHHICLGPGTYTFTSWQERADEYSLSYRNTSSSQSEMDYGQLLPSGDKVLEVVDVSHLPFAWMDIGSTVTPGNSKNNGTRVWIVEGAGKGIMDNSDSFHYLYAKAWDNVNFTTFVENFSGGTNVLSVGGIMFRESLDEDSRHYSMFVTGEHGLQNRYRRSCIGCDTFYYNEPNSALKKVWLRVSKQGNAFNAYVKENISDEWKKYGPTTYIHFSSAEYFVGFAVSAHNAYRPATLEASNVEILLERENEMREFVFTLWEEHKILPHDGGTNDLFGTAVALQGDTAVVGAPSNDNDIGYSRVFIRVGEAWEEQDDLQPLDGEGGEMFGEALALDGNTLIIGANQASDSDKGEYAGAAYVFMNTGGTWKQEDKLLPQDVVGGEMFGFSLALDGTTLVVGAPSFQNETMGGTAYVFIHDGDMWKEQAKLLPHNRSADMYFGCSVALDGDTVVVGSYRDYNNNGEKSGSAYVFVRNGEAWEEQAKLLPQSGTDGAEFGSKVALKGNTIAIGAPLDNEMGTSSGSAHVFIRDEDSTWMEQTKLLSHDGESFDKFGIDVTLDGDNIVVGAQGDSDKGFRSGAAYLFSRSGGIWQEKAKLLAHDGDEGDWFGSAVALDGDTVIISARLDEENGVESGSAYIFSTPLSEISKSQPISQDPSESSLPVHAPAPPTHCTYVDVGINVFTDWNPEETSWDLTKVIRTDGSTEREVFFKNSAELGETWYNDTKKICLEDGEYEFNFFDTGGDGLTCTEGYYDVTLDGQHIAGSRAGGGRWKFSHRTVPFSVPSSCEEVMINVRTDSRKYDTSWTLARIIAADLISNNSEVVILDEDQPEYEESLHTDTVCLERGEYNFTIYDSKTRQDGLCCVNGEGYYNITSKDGELIARGDEFGEHETVLFSVPFVASQSPSSEPTGSPPPSPSPSISSFPTKSVSPTAYCEDVQIDILTDVYPEDTTWNISKLVAAEDGSYYAEDVAHGDPETEETLHTYAVCLEMGEYNFTLYDEYDGLCCENGEGSYKITVSGKVVAEGGEFTSESETVPFTIPAPSSPTACEWVELEVSFEEFPSESGWYLSQLSNLEGGANAAQTAIPYYTPEDDSLAYGIHIESLCLETGEYEFIMYDYQNRGVASYHIKSNDGTIIVEGGEFEYQSKNIFKIPFLF